MVTQLRGNRTGFEPRSVRFNKMMVKNHYPVLPARHYPVKAVVIIGSIIVDRTGKSPSERK